MGAYKYVYFDLDGTLIDHFDAIHQSFAHAGLSLGLEAPSYEKVVATVGGSVPITASKLFPDADVTKIVELFEAHFDTVMYDAVEIYAGTEWILKELHQKGIHNIVFTNKLGDKARKICRYLKLDLWLKGIVGTGDTPHRKPQKAFSEYALRQFQADPTQSCVIGDSPFDEQSAKVVGMDCYLVATGSHDIEVLQRETNSPVYADLNQLGKAVFGL